MCFCHACVYASAALDKIFVDSIGTYEMKASVIDFILSSKLQIERGLGEFTS